MDGVVPQGAGAGVGQPPSEQHLHWLALVQENTQIPLRFGQLQAFRHGDIRLCGIPHPLQRQCFENHDFDEPARPPA